MLCITPAMSEWWTYRLSDFLMFSPRTYWRLVENYNRDLWPAQLLALSVGLAAIWLATSQRARAGRAIAALLATAWLWVGWAFHWQRYATINWAAQYFAVAFAVQAVLLLGLWILRHREDPPASGAAAQRAGWLLAVAAVLLYPLAGLLAGRPWSQAEVFGIAPEPTALATLGLLLAGRRLPARATCWALAIIPALSLLLGAATLWTLSG